MRNFLILFGFVCFFLMGCVSTRCVKELTLDPKYDIKSGVAGVGITFKFEDCITDETLQNRLAILNDNLKSLNTLLKEKKIDEKQYNDLYDKNREAITKALDLIATSLVQHKGKATEHEEYKKAFSNLVNISDNLDKQIQNIIYPNN